MLKTLLGISDLDERIEFLEEYVVDLEKDLDQVQDRQDAIGSELDDIQDVVQEKVGDEELEDRIQEVVEEMEFVQEETEEEQDEFSPTEKQILRELFHTDGFIGTGEIADSLGKSSGTVRKYMSMLKDKIELSTRKDGRKTLYRLPTQVQDEILEGTREISLSQN